MANVDFQNLVQKVMSDDVFAANLSKDPEGALKSAGITPTGELLDALKGVDVGSIRKLAVTFKGDQAAAA
jgi:hypothetical protein